MSSNLNMNKIAGAILLAGLIGMVSGLVTEFLYDGGPEHPGEKIEEKRGYKVEGVVASGDGAAAADTGAPDISALYATADAKAGGDFFDKKCTTCHNIAKGAGTKVGPELWGVIGRKVASMPGFNYSSGMKSHADRTWTFDEMNHFQWNPHQWVPGTIMGYAGTPKDTDRANLIVYLNSQSDHPLPLPKPTAAKPADKAAAAKPGDKGADKAAKSGDKPADPKAAGKTATAAPAAAPAATPALLRQNNQLFVIPAQAGI